MTNETEIELLYTKEQEILDKSNKVLEKIDQINFDELKSSYITLVEEYEHLFKQQIKLTKLADSSQRKLRKSQLILDENNQKINTQNEELSKLNLTKDKFFPIISHDLRNPITAIMLMSDLLYSNHDRFDKERTLTQLKKISDSVKTLHEMIETIHKWSKSQSGNIDFEPEEFNLALLVNNVFSVVKVQADNKFINLDNDLDPMLIAYADKNMVETIIRNLVSNAIKFTNTNGNISIYQNMSNIKDLEIIIQDDGVGMDESTRVKLFKIGGKGISRKGTAREPGSGLGLILCKEFIDKHNGDIWVESEIGVGSKFHIQLPK